MTLDVVGVLVSYKYTCRELRHVERIGKLAVIPEHDRSYRDRVSTGDYE